MDSSVNKREGDVMKEYDMEASAAPAYAHQKPTGILLTIWKRAAQATREAALNHDFPTAALVLDGLDTVMGYNVFSFGSRRLLQLDGTAMGTLCACNYATIYYSSTTKRQICS
jgi:hypothetical protein